MSYFVHESSVIDEGVEIGTGSKIWHFCHVLESSRIGRDCVIGQNCAIGARVRIGDRCKIQNNVSVYQGVEVGDDVFIGPSVVFTNVLRPRAFISRKHAFLPTRLHKGCSIGANATIICGVEIGRYALVGAGAVVSHNVPEFALVVGNPARVVGYVDMAGERLEFDKNGRATSAYDGSEYVRESGRVRLVERGQDSSAQDSSVKKSDGLESGAEKSLDSARPLDSGGIDSGRLDSRAKPKSTKSTN